ncbi:fimbrillin family protein [Phocaeicola sp.]|uniref:fimbrillin family protein n=1 Tax=Phocaeicola sp. TaxID=2773926 RepID=UPI003A91E7D0
MKKNIFWIILFLLANGCTNEPAETQYPTSAIKGREIGCFKSPSRSSLDEANETLPTGSTMTFYSQGGIHADELLFSYNGTIWEGETHPRWEDVHQEAITMSYCPPLYRNHQSFYQEGTLCDQLYAQTTTAYGNDIYLSFQHLFARIIFNVSDQLNLLINQIEFIPSSSVISIIPESGEISCQNSTTSILMERNEKGTYTFLIPPTTLSITIRIHTTTGEIHESLLDEYPFTSGHEYTCPIKRAGENPGISTVEDFIAFTHLINGESYGNRTLEEFGEKTGETTTYYLLNDLTFTSEESAQIKMIGMYGTSSTSQKRLFNDVFDGQGHSLNSLQYTHPTSGYYYSGLFSGISSSATIRNLIINQAVYNNPDDTNKSSFLAGINKGKIENCIIRNCEIEQIDEKNEFGSISSRNEGSIINCHIDNINLKIKTIYGNGITRYNYEGKIMNCAVTNCKFNKVQLGGGLICNRTRNGDIQNCYIAGSTSNTSKCNAISLVAEESNTIRCCFYPQAYTKAPVGTNYTSSPSDSLMKYGSQQAITEDNLFQVLNQWALGNGAQLYPEYSFCLWKKGESLPAVLVSP